MIAAPARAPWQNPRVVSTLMMVFLAGAASGALWMQLGLHDRLHRTAVSNPAPTRETVLQRFNSELGLSQDQSQKIADCAGGLYAVLSELAGSARRRAGHRPDTDPSDPQSRPKGQVREDHERCGSAAGSAASQVRASK